MNILVTGAAGFIGSVVTEVLCNHGHKVTAWDSLINGHRDSIDRRAHFESVDLLDAAKVSSGLKALCPDAVVHLAAEALIEESMRDPGRFYRANLVGGIHLLDAMIASGSGRRLVFSSTAAVYGQPDHVPISEEMAGNPCNSYGESKWAFERALQWYESAHGLRHITFRYFNACGATVCHGEDHRPETHIIPLLFETALGKHGMFQLYGSDYDTPDGTCIRDYVHVADIAEAHRIALERIDALDSGQFNLGLARGYSNREVIVAVEKITGLRIDVRQSARRQGDPAVLVADPSFAHRILDWKPVYSDLEAMIVTAWNWCRKHPEGYRI
jgi:UDP-glucose 4-epimerase